MSFNHTCPERPHQKDCDVCIQGRMLYGKKPNFQHREKDLVCPHTGEDLKLSGEVPIGKSGPKMTPNQVQSEAHKRSQKHFVDSVYPSLPPGEQPFFRNKHNIKDR
jgi:hypothetical protein